MAYQQPMQQMPMQQMPMQPMMMPMPQPEKKKMSTGAKIAIFLVVLLLLWLLYEMAKPAPVAVAPDPNKTVTNTTGGTSTVLVPVTPPAPAPAPLPPAKASGPLVGTFQADNYLTVKLNGTVVYNGCRNKTGQCDQRIDWGEAQTVNLPTVVAGDRVDFLVENVGGPGMFIGSWTWNGKTYNTTESQFPGFKNEVWGRGTWGIPDTRYPGAQWLWTPDQCQFCTNTFTWVAA